MKRIRLTSSLLLLLCFQFAFAQSYMPGNMQYDGESRSYSIYVPSSYDGNTEVPLIFNFHGGSGDIASQIATSDLSELAEINNFIAVYPQALPDPNDGGSTNWIHKDPTDVDDVFFIDALIDEVAQSFAIDESRVYACGYSLGGEFTFEVGCRLNERIAAIGVVARTMQTFTFENCAPVHPTGVITILGTADPISPYEGIVWAGEQYYLSADETHDYWFTFNNCDSVPSSQDLPNISLGDGSTVEQYIWSDSEGCAYVEHLKVINGGHDWPGTFGNMDIDATSEIWNFVSRYDLNGLMDCSPTSIVDFDGGKEELSVYPNPFSNVLQIESSSQGAVRLYSVKGELIKIVSLEKGLSTLMMEGLAPGVYFLEFKGERTKIVKTN